MDLKNTSEIRNQNDLERFKVRIQKHYNHFIDIFSDSSTDLEIDDIKDYFIEIRYNLVLCYEVEPEDNEVKEGFTCKMKFKCPHCSLEFIVLTHNKKWHIKFQPTCPECKKNLADNKVVKKYILSIISVDEPICNIE